MEAANGGGIIAFVVKVQYFALVKLLDHVLRMLLPLSVWPAIFQEGSAPTI